MHIGVTVFNFEDGGLLPGGGYDFAPGIRAIAADPVYTDVVVLLEANQYGHDGETPLNRFVNALSEAARVPLVGRLGELDRGHFAPALIWNPQLGHRREVVRVRRAPRCPAAYELLRGARSGR